MNKTVLCIMDGLGHNPSEFGNAVHASNMVNLEKAMREYPSTYLKASGREVGLADDKDAGNSEIGHNAIGAGQYIKQGLSLFNELLSGGGVFKSEAWKILEERALEKGRKLNIIVLLSDGRVHSDIAHLFRVLDY